MALVPGQFRPGIEIIDFQTYQNEAILFDTIACESTDIAGFKIEYYIHKSDNTDLIYGEDVFETYDGPYTTKIMYKPEKEHHLTDAFGMSSGDTIVDAEIPKTIFTRDVLSLATSATSATIILTPKPKDLLKTLWNNKVYEISDVSDENKVFIGNKLIWTLILTPFKYSQQDTTDSIMFTIPSSADMPLVNLTIDTPPTSAIDDSSYINDESADIDTYNDIDTKMYGF